MKIKKTPFIVLILLLTIFLQLTTFSHSGRTDRSGGHKDNKNKSGLGHYHCGGHPAHLHKNGMCPYRKNTSNNNVYSTKIVAKEILAKSIVIDDKLTNMLIGETQDLTASLTPENVTNKNIEWISDNPDIISVTSDGKITAKAIGTATIKAIHKEFSDICVIEVIPIEAENIEIILPTSNRIAKGSQIDVKAIITPENTTDKTVKWSVSNTSIAQINNDGRLTTIGSGTVTITATTANGADTKTDIDVYSYIPTFTMGICGASAATAGVYFFMRKRKKHIKTE